MSAFLSLADAVVAALLAAPAVATGYVERNRWRPMPAERNVEVLVHLERASGEAASISSGPIDWDTVLRIECQARPTTGLDAEHSVDALLATVFTRLSAASLITAGVMDLALLPEIEWDYSDAEQLTVCATLTLRARQRTQPDTLTAWS